MRRLLKVYVNERSVVHSAQEFVVARGALHAVFDEFHRLDRVSVGEESASTIPVKTHDGGDATQKETQTSQPGLPVV